MYRVRNQIGCTEKLQASCGNKGITVAMLDTGERVIIMSS